MMEFKEQLKKIMEIRGITQSELCEKTGISKSAISQYISGSFKPKQERTYILATALKTTPEFLMGLTDEPDAPAKDTRPAPSSDRDRWERVIAQYDTMTAEERRRIDTVLDAFFPDTDQKDIIKETTVGAELDRRAATDDESEETVA